MGLEGGDELSRQRRRPDPVALGQGEDRLRTDQPNLAVDVDPAAFEVDVLDGEAEHLAFAMAARLRDRFGIPTEVLFNALDNAPYELIIDPASGHRYQRAYAQALDAKALLDLVTALYQPLFMALSRRLGIPHRIETYTQQQAA